MTKKSLNAFIAILLSAEMLWAVDGTGEAVVSDHRILMGVGN